MRNRSLSLSLLTAWLFLSAKTFASGDHAHEPKQVDHAVAKSEHSQEEKGEDHDHHKEDEGHGEKEEGHEHGGEEEEASAGVGPDKAVTAASHEEGIQLSEKATKTIDLKAVPLKTAGTSTYEVPQSALVFAQDKTGIYRLRNGWFKFVEAKVLRKSGASVFITSPSLNSEDSIAVKGVALLRVADLEAFGGSGDGHGH